MKANKAPEKIYIFEDELQCEDHVVIYGVNQDKGIKGLIEYTRTDAMQKEPTSVWHDAIEVPEIHRKFLARYADGKINGSWERHDDGVLPWKGVVREHKITHCCYVEDLNKTIRL